MLLNQILQTKLRIYYKAKNAEHSISSALSFFDLINLLSVIKNKKIEAEEINQNFRLLHNEIFEDIFNKIKIVNSKEISLISKEEFNQTFNFCYNTDERTITCRKNINNIIQKTFPLLIQQLNKIPIQKVVTGDISGDIGVLKDDLI